MRRILEKKKKREDEDVERGEAQNVEEKGEARNDEEKQKVGLRRGRIVDEV